MLRVVEAANIKQVRRRPRRPQHKFNLKSKPYEIVPFMMAPVLPGETMQNLLLQARVVTDPIKNRLVGWHKEYYFFYVSHLAMSDYDTTGKFRAMMLDPTTDLTSLDYDANTETMYGFKEGIAWQSYAANAVIKEFFRDEGEALTPVLDQFYAAQIDQDQWYKSLKPEAETGDDSELPGVDEIEELDILPGFTTAYAQWEIMRDSGLVDVDYDDFIRSYGVDVPKAEEVENIDQTAHRPELIRFSRNWQYPTNHIDPTDGSATSAVSWSIAERADKRRFFKYPGFIIGLTITRPKIYLGNQKGAAVGFLNNAYAWLPSVLHGHVYTAVKELLDSTEDPGAGILQNQTDDYWFDVKDLYLYGDQWVNYTMDQVNTNKVALPTADGGHKYVTEADVDALFVTAGSEYVREDGVTHLNILGKLSESTP